MLERTAGCLGESGTLRRLLPVSKKSTKSRRTLHSSFWSHGALDLELSPLWTALVRAADAADHSADTHAQQKTPHTMLLEFLYPAGTLNFLRSYSGWWTDRPDGRFPRGGLGRLGYRRFTSSATDTSTRDEMGPELDASGGTASSIIPHGSTEFLYAKLNLTRSYDYEEAWRKFKQLEAIDQQPLRPALIRYLSVSSRIIDAERTTELFDMLDVGQQNADSSRWVVRAYLKLRNLSDAMLVHKAALENFRSPAGSAELLVYFIQNSSWSRAVSLHEDVQQFKKKHDSDFDLYSALNTIPNLSTFAKGLAEFADQNFEAANKDCSSTVDVRSFAAQIMQQALTRPEGFDAGNFLSLLHMLQKWQFDTKELYDDIFFMLLRLNETKLLVQCYRKARNNEHIVFSIRTLKFVLKIFCSFHSVIGMKQVLDDYFRMHGAPSRYAYNLCMTEFASQGDTQTVYALFDQFKARFLGVQENNRVKFLIADDFAPILQVHTKRGEFVQVVEQFRRIESDFGLQPTILCYNILLNACGKVHNFDMALSTFNEILASPSLTPDDYTLGTMLGICSLRGDIDLAMEVYGMAENLKISPTMAMVDALVHCYCQDDQLDKAEEQCESALRMNFKGNKTRMWNYLLVAYAMRYDIVGVNRVLQRMNRARVDYDQYTYSALMQALCMAKQPNRAYSILKDVMPEAGVIATHFHYAIVMGGYIATGELQKVFHVYNRLTKRAVRSSASTNLLLMKGLAEEEQMSHNQKTDPQLKERDFKKALDLFQHVLSSADAQDNSDTTRKSAKGLPADIAYPSVFYGYIMFILGQNGQFRTVEALYDTFRALLPNFGKNSPPLNVLSAYMHSKLREGGHEAVHECWQLALSEAKQAGSPLPSLSIDSAQSTGSNQSEHLASVRLVQTERELTNAGEKVLRTHRLKLSSALNIYMQSLTVQDKPEELAKVVQDYESNGFEMDGRNWNLYVELQARNFGLRRAFQACEDKLMSGFTGWARLRRERPERNRLPKEIRRIRKDPRHMRPTAQTLLWLAKGYLSIEAHSGEDRAAERMLEWMAHACPKTVNALKTMPRSDEYLEVEVLQD